MPVTDTSAFRSNGRCFSFTGLATKAVFQLMSVYVLKYEWLEPKNGLDYFPKAELVAFDSGAFRSRPLALIASRK